MIQQQLKGGLQLKNRDKLLALFKANGEAFLSGQKIADHLHCSRTAIWKQMDQLRKEGFLIEAVRNKGYRLQVPAEKYTRDTLLMNLDTVFMGKQLYFYETVDSTQFEAKKLVNEEAIEGTVVISDEQQIGKGRLNRLWDSQKGQGIWMSLIVKPDIPLAKAPQFTFIASLAIVSAIEKITKLTPQIKWPNDIYIGKRKVCGVLTEMQAEADRIQALILGIGINVNQVSFPDELALKATSLQMESGEVISRTALFQTIMLFFEKYYQLYLEKGFEPVKLLWESKAIPFEEELIANTLKGSIRGKVKGISDEGVLIMEDRNGDIHEIYSADIVFDKN